MRRFQDKVVVITGGGAGIGRRMGHRFAEEGASIVIVDRDPDVGLRSARELADEGCQSLSFPMDVTDDDAAAHLAEAVVSRFGGIDVLINNAGIHLDHAQLPFSLDAVAQWRRVLDVNVIGALVCAAACHDTMADRGGGAIINMSSMAAYMGAGAYGVSKLALNALTVGLAQAYGSEGTRVNGIAPGLVDSESAVEWVNDPARSGLNIEQLLVGNQMIKRSGRMDDLADVALFLCSDQASFVTGQTILVDGGHTKKPF
ncbi:MAG TPA: SDR family oxidoreductase [Acidimicrobiales bacterium]|nr:SDR family oxidoreductase [Acidimicrobiales bacterium]